MKIRLSYKCDNRWEELEPSDDGRRFCAECQHHVHDLRGLSDDELRAFREEHRGERVCVAHVPERPQPGPRRPWAGAVALTLPLLLAGCDAEPEARAQPVAVVVDRPVTELGAPRSPSSVETPIERQEEESCDGFEPTPTTPDPPADEQKVDDDDSDTKSDKDALRPETKKKQAKSKKQEARKKKKKKTHKAIEDGMTLGILIHEGFNGF